MFLKKYKISDISKRFSLEEARKRARILLIDDEDTFPVALLQKEGYNITHWKKVESINSLEKGDFDIIILDIFDVAKEISEEDGLGVLEHLKKANPAQIIVAYSGRSFDLSKARFWKLADDTLAKPSDLLKCKQVIDHLLQEKFTLEHYWQGIVKLLREYGLPDKEIRNLESSIAKSILERENPNVGSRLSKFIEKAEVVIRISDLIANLITIAR